MSPYVPERSMSEKLAQLKTLSALGGRCRCEGCQNNDDGRECTCTGCPACDREKQDSDRRRSVGGDE